MNSALYGNSYPIPDEILELIHREILKGGGNGLKRGKMLLNNKTCSYPVLKRIKNHLDYNADNMDEHEYNLIGGDMMRQFVEDTLRFERDRTKRSSGAKQEIQTQMDDPSVRAQTGQVELADGSMVKEEEEPDSAVSDDGNDGVSDGLNLHAVAIVFNNDMKILMLKRGPEAPWYPNKWSFPGGGVEEDEKPIDAIKREIREETGIDTDSFVEKFAIQRDDNVEHIFICKSDSNDIKLNFENEKHGWLNTEQIKKLDLVPNVLDYLRIAAEYEY